VAQCDQKDLAERYIRIMEQNQIDPWWINLEITETASVQAKNTLLKNMKELIDFGVSFSLDDFGNGQSNLDYIIDMPVSIMKLDMNMIRSYFVDLKARFVVQAAIRMAHDMDLMVVAEGVETKEQLDTMVEEKIDYIQGYYFSKPLPADEFIAYLEKHQDGFVDK
jgi:EAL domain-containing protein (putative c-di-GMP-specific phosphodiesterase class I)